MNNREEKRASWLDCVRAYEESGLTQTAFCQERNISLTTFSYFAGNPRGAQAGAILYSLLMIAKENGLNKHAYLTFVFNRIRACKTESDYQKLLPGYLTPEEQASLALK